MIINKLTIKNFKSFGNDEKTIDLSNEGNLILLSGKNGAGKCVDKRTSIDIEINDLQLTDKLNNFLINSKFGVILHYYIIKCNIPLYKKIFGSVGIEDMSPITNKNNLLTIQIGDLLELSKVVDIYNSDIKVNTPTGLNKIKAVDITSRNSEVMVIKTKKHELMCSPDHLIKSKNIWVKAKALKVGNQIHTKYGECSIESTTLLDYRGDLLDLHVDTNEYYTNDILSHNSSIMDSFDYVFFNKVKGRKNKKVKLSSLPNRINSNLENTIEFTADGGTEIKIVRGYKPSKLELWENGIKNERAGNSKLEELIENYIGIDYDTFKSFISMSINDFKNFISLSNEDKKLLLDRLFNLEVINTLSKILNKIISDNKRELDVHDREIEIIGDNIDNINTSIEKVKQSKKDNIESDIKELREGIVTNKVPFDEVKQKIQSIKDKKKEITDEIDLERTTLIETNSEINQIDKQLKLFENDKCPTCQADLSSGFHKGIKESYVEKKEKLEEILKVVKTKGMELKSKITKLDKILENGNEKFNDLSSTLKSMKREYDLLLEKKDSNNKNDSDLDEFVKTVVDLENKSKNIKINKSVLEDKSIYHKYLKSVFSEGGVKKSIIQNIVGPINHFIQENLQKMHLPFEVMLDDTFNAEITSFGEEIDVDTLSSGENKAINICILIAYLKLIRTKRQVNVLFLDEVFSSIDVEKINDVLILLRDLVQVSNINIFLVHHSIIDPNKFDKVLSITKDIFSDIEDISNN